MKLLALLIVLSGCAQVTSLNLRKHQFGRQPTKLIWFQVAGLDNEQLAMLRFGYPNASEKTSFENALCIGQAWSFNLYHLRPKVTESMLAQVTGKKDVSGTCEDWKLKPVWNYLSTNGYKAGILEVDARNDESLLAAKGCPAGADKFLGESIIWSMRADAPYGSQSYLPSVAQDFKAGGLYWDKSCNAQGCGTALRTAMASIYQQFAKNSTRHILIVRDFSLKHSLDKQNFVAARESLREIDKAVESFFEATEDHNDLLVVVSGAGSVDIDFPAEGKDWQNFDLKGSGAMTRKGELLSPVFAQGARAENFCGFYEEAQLFERLLSGPKQQGLELKVINPFN